MSSTSSSGILGHVGIVLPDENNIVNIAGSGHTADKISISQWLSRYSQTKVVRGTNLSLPYTSLGASYYRKNFFVEGEGSNIPYGIFGPFNTVESKGKLYCSKLVWQCYNAAGLVYEVLQTTPSGDTYRVPYKISPYDFLDAHALKHNGFSVVKSFNWN